MEAVAVVTGGASGIGLAVARELASSGWFVVLADLDAEVAEERASDLAAAGWQCVARQLDITDRDDVNRAITSVVAAQGRLDLVVNSAGTSLVGEVTDLSDDDWRRSVDVNLWGAVHVTTAAYRIMVAQGFGHIVNVASGAGLFPAGLRVPYTMAKHGVVGLSTALRLEGRDLGVKVSVVCPGAVATNIFKTATVVGAPREMIERGLSGARMMTPERAAKLIVRGVRRNRAVIPLSGAVRSLWRLHRVAPGLSYLLLGRNVRKWRRLREEVVADSAG